MKTRILYGTAALMLALAATPSATLAQSADEPAPPFDPGERVLRYDLAGPRLGATFAPNGDAITQFGWHFESQAGPTRRGPWFIVERVLLVGGLENNQLIPNGSLIFGMRLPNSFEFGLGPSVTLGGRRGLNSGIVAAVGHSFRAGGIRIPVNVAVASERGGEVRWTLLTGWAIRDQVGLTSTHARWPERRTDGGGI